MNPFFPAPTRGWQLYGELALGLAFALIAPPIVLAVIKYQELTGKGLCPNSCRCSCNDTMGTKHE